MKKVLNICFIHLCMGNRKRFARRSPDICYIVKCARARVYCRNDNCDSCARYRVVARFNGCDDAFTRTHETTTEESHDAIWSNDDALAVYSFVLPFVLFEAKITRYISWAIALELDRFRYKFLYRQYCSLEFSLVLKNWQLYYCNTTFVLWFTYKDCTDD